MYNLRLIQFDVRTAFSNSSIRNTIHLSIPQGFKIDENKYVLKLNHSI